MEKIKEELVERLGYHCHHGRTATFPDKAWDEYDVDEDNYYHECMSKPIWFLEMELWSNDLKTFRLVFGDNTADNAIDRCVMSLYPEEVYGHHLLKPLVPPKPYDPYEPCNDDEYNYASQKVWDVATINGIPVRAKVN